MRIPRVEYLLPVLIVLSAVALIISEFLIAFEFAPPGGEVQAEQTAADRHGFAMLVLAVGALIALFTAIGTGARRAALAVAGFGAVALILFLVIDLPDAGKVGPLENFVTARADAQPGFWLAALGALGLAIGGGGLATLPPEHLRALGRRLPWSQGPPGKEEAPPSGTT